MYILPGFGVWPTCFSEPRLPPQRCAGASRPFVCCCIAGPGQRCR